MYNFHPDREEILKEFQKLEDNGSIQDCFAIVRKEFFKEYTYLKNNHWNNVSSEIMHLGFKRDINVLEKYYLTFKSRSFEAGSIGKYTKRSKWR
ncbi:MAG: hypothetical protein AAGF07_03890 [Patescibacteria group bacterium]